MTQSVSVQQIKTKVFWKRRHELPLWVEDALNDGSLKVIGDGVRLKRGQIEYIGGANDILVRGDDGVVGIKHQ